MINLFNLWIFYQTILKIADNNNKNIYFFFLDLKTNILIKKSSRLSSDVF